MLKSASNVECPPPQGISEPVNLDLVKSELVETNSVKHENVTDGFEGSDGTPQNPTGKLPTSQSDLCSVTVSQADVPCSALHDNPTPSSYQGETFHGPGDPLKEETLLLYEESPEVEENDPLADPVFGSQTESTHSVDLDGVKPSSDILVSSRSEIFKAAIQSKGEHSLNEGHSNKQSLEQMGLDAAPGLNLASFTNPGAAKPPLCNALASVKDSVQENLVTFEQGDPSQKQAKYSIPNLKDTSVAVSLPSAIRKKTSVNSNERKISSSTKSRARRAILTRPEKEFLKMVFAPSGDSKPYLCLYKHQLDHSTKSVVYNVVNYFQKKREKFNLNYDSVAIASDATKMSKQRIRSIMSIGRRSLKDDPTLEFPIFLRHHTRKCKNCGDVLVDFAIREIIFNGYIEERKGLTIKEIHSYLEADELSVCEDFLSRRIRDLGFELLRTIATPKYIPLERPELAAGRYRYCEDIQKYRIMQRPIVYVFEADLSKVFHHKFTWEPLEGHPTENDSHAMTVIHAAQESGFLNGSLFVHSDFSRQHRRKILSHILFWLNWNLPKFPKGSVVVLGHTRHNIVRPAKPKPDASWPKQDIVKWLHDHKQGSFSTDLPSAVLLEKVDTIDVGTKFGIDDLIISYGHIPLHLPPNHRELNPVELVWRKILAKLPSIDVSSDIYWSVENFLKNEFESVPLDELQEAFEMAKNHENILRLLDMKLDEPVAEVIRGLGGILDRSHALKGDGSDDDLSTDYALGRLYMNSSEVRIDECESDEVSLVQPTKKLKTTDQTQAVEIEPDDQSAQLISQNSPSAWNNFRDMQVADGWHDSQLSILEDNPKTSEDSKDKRTSRSEAADCSVGLSDESAWAISGDVCENSQLKPLNANLGILDETSLVPEKREASSDDCSVRMNHESTLLVPSSSYSSWNHLQKSCTQGVDGCDDSQLIKMAKDLRTLDEVSLIQPTVDGMAGRTQASNIQANDPSAQPIPQSSVPSQNISQGISNQGTDDGDSTQLKTSDKGQVDSELMVSSCWSFAAVKTDPEAIRIPSVSETTEIISVNLSNPGPSNSDIRSQSASRSESMDDGYGITLKPPLKKHSEVKLFWEPSHHSLTALPKASTESFETPPLEPEDSPLTDQSKTLNSDVDVIHLDDSDEENPCSIDLTGKKENQISHLECMETESETTHRTPCTRMSSPPLPEHPLEPELFRDLKILITRPHTVETPDVLRHFINSRFKNLKKKL